MGEIKQANFRIDTESADAFRRFCDEQGYNQAQGFDHLIQVLELNRAKAGIEGRLTEITTFEEYVKKIMDAYLTSLQVAQDTEERVREDYKTDILLRDKALADSERKIIDRDEKISELTVCLQDAQKIAKESLQSAENAEKQAASATQIADEKGKVNDMLSAKLAEAEEKLAGYDELRSSEENLKKQISDMQHKADMITAELSHANEQNADLIKQLETISASLESAKDKNAEMKTQIMSLNRDLEEQKRAADQKFAEQKRESEQAQELAVERAVIQAEKKMQDQISALRDENVRLQVQIEMLRENSKNEE